MRLSYSNWALLGILGVLGGWLCLVVGGLAAVTAAWDGNPSGVYWAVAATGLLLLSIASLIRVRTVLRRSRNSGHVLADAARRPRRRHRVLREIIAFRRLRRRRSRDVRDGPDWIWPTISRRGSIPHVKPE